MPVLGLSVSSSLPCGKDNGEKYRNMAKDNLNIGLLRLVLLLDLTQGLSQLSVWASFGQPNSLKPHIRIPPQNRE